MQMPIGGRMQQCHRNLTRRVHLNVISLSVSTYTYLVDLGISAIIPFDPRCLNPCSELDPSRRGAFVDSLRK
jgi:hypothetical protein